MNVFTLVKNHSKCINIVRRIMLRGVVLFNMNVFTLVS
jgi:hypothetical protein